MAKCLTCTFNNNVIAYRHPQMSPSVRVSVTSFASFEAMRDSFFFTLHGDNKKNKHLFSRVGGSSKPGTSPTQRWSYVRGTHDQYWWYTKQIKYRNPSWCKTLQFMINLLALFVLFLKCFCTDRHHIAHPRQLRNFLLCLLRIIGTPYSWKELYFGKQKGEKYRCC
jgi:hypothetical protein